MLRPKIWFTEHELGKMAKDSGLSKLALLGLIELMNQYTYSDELIAVYKRDEDMGRHI